jgi:hypothetical protein
MDNNRLSLPEQRHYEYALNTAYELAAEELRQTNLSDLYRRTGARYLEKDKEKLILIDYLSRQFVVELPAIEITHAVSEEPVSLREQVLILHYLTQARGTLVTGRLINFKELPDGSIYYPTFAKRTVDPLVKTFGNHPDLLIIAARGVGGLRREYGDVAVAIDVFPFITIVLVLWKGDDEFNPSGSIIFDACIKDYLSTEDITVLCETLVWKLVKGSSKI